MPLLLNQKKSNYLHQTKFTTSLPHHCHLMPSLYSTKELTLSLPPPRQASLLSKKQSNLKSTQPSVPLSARKTTLPSSTHLKLPNHFSVSILTAIRCIHFLYYNKNNHGLTSTFTASTMFTILFLSLKNFDNLLNCVLLFILNYVTPTHTPQRTERQWRNTYSFWQKHGLGSCAYLMVLHRVQTTSLRPVYLQTYWQL